MAGKALIPLAAGGLALFLIADSAPKKKSSKKKNGNGNGDPLVVDTGMVQDWGWMVRKSAPRAGFGTLYYGLVRSPGADSVFKNVHQDGVPEAKMAKNLALEFIAQQLEG